MNNSVKSLVEKYEAERDFYLSSGYNESQLRNDFLDPLFGMMGWDIRNEAALPTSEREVVLEASLKDDSLEHARKPDYTFRHHGERKFFLEAKKPCVHIEKDPAPAIQLRRYGYTANLKVSVLSNFEYLVIYDVTVKVDEKDSCQRALVKKYHYSEYEEKFDEICQLLGRESVYGGCFDEQWNHIETRVKHWSVDSQFLEQINGWRIMLGREILAVSPKIGIEALGDEVQDYINKILFLRVCEDRDIEEYRTLLTIAKKGRFDALLDKFKKADARYNSGLFALPSSAKVVCRASSAFWTIIRQLYYPESPYSFGVLSSDILGRIYEIFIAHRLSLAEGGLQIVKKPEYANRDVVTTPTFIIREILRQVLLPFCAGKSADEIFKLKVADIACGSGAFAMEAFQLLNDCLIDYFIKHDKSRLVKTGEGSYRLRFSDKKRLLVSCIFGVDKDFNAVEACKFGLLLKLLEGEDAVSVKGEQPILPDLANNIHFGNSLLAPSDVEAKDVESVNPFDFGGMRFDVIVGNPPYLPTEGMKKTTPGELALYKAKYKSAYKQFDKYFLFVERALGLLKENGGLGYIIPLKFMKVGAGRELRRLISEGGFLDAITSFGACQVFDDKSNYTCLLVLGKSRHDSFRYCEVEDIAKWRLLDRKSVDFDVKSASEITEKTWALFPERLRGAYDALTAHSVKLSAITGADNIYNGIQTSANAIYIFRPVSCKNGVYTFHKGDAEWHVEEAVTRPYYETPRGDDKGFDAYCTFKPNSRVIFPYSRNVDGKLELIPLSEIKKSYPFLYRYLMAHKSALSAPTRDIKPRPATDDEWYRYGRHQSLDACDLPQKIIVGVLSTGGKFAVDNCHTFVSSGGTAGYCIIALPEDSKYSIYYLQAILNSKYYEWLCSIYGEIFHNGFIARGTKVLNQLLVRVIDFSDKVEKSAHDSIASLQRGLIELGDRMITCGGDKRSLVVLRRKFNAERQKLDAAIARLCGMGEFDSIIPIIKDVYAAS